MFKVEHGGSDEANHSIGNGFGDDPCINRGMLALVV
jgi:hypothetical protein